MQVIAVNTQQKRKRGEEMRTTTRWSGMVVVAFLAGLFVAAPAAATYEQVNNFAGTLGLLQSDSYEKANWPEDVQLGGVGGMAVNTSGAGGVPPGTIYAVVPPYAYPPADPRSEIGNLVGVARFDPDGEFRGAWTV